MTNRESSAVRIVALASATWGCGKMCLPYVICFLMDRPITGYAVSVGPRWLEVSAGLSLLFVALPLSIVLSMRRLVLGPVIFIVVLGSLFTPMIAHLCRRL
jgi:hypothetical protein